MTPRGDKNPETKILNLIYRFKQCFSFNSFMNTFFYLTINYIMIFVTLISIMSSSSSNSDGIQDAAVSVFN